MLLKIGDRMRKIILKYILLGLPFLVGSVMFSFGVYNIISSFLFFVGGYVFIKNVFDYRKISKNKKMVVDNQIVVEKKNMNYRTSENIPMLKRTRIHHRVRKRVKI